MTDRLTTTEVTEQLERFNAFLQTIDLIKIGNRLCHFMAHDAKDGRYTPYVYLLRVLRNCAKVSGTCSHPNNTLAGHYSSSYRDVLEYEAIKAYVDSVQPTNTITL
jgi:hypothetical protein